MLSDNAVKYPAVQDLLKPPSPPVTGADSGGFFETLNRVFILTY